MTKYSSNITDQLTYGSDFYNIHTLFSFFSEPQVIYVRITGRIWILTGCLAYFYSPRDHVQQLVSDPPGYNRVNQESLESNI